MSETLLAVDRLEVHYDGQSVFREPISFAVARGEAVALAGASGSGKTSVALALMGLLPKSAAAQGSVLFDGLDLLRATPQELRTVRGKRVALISQDPGGWLNPVQHVDDQVAEAITAHADIKHSAARVQARQLLERVGISQDAARRYPHELSGGMRQRVAIAMAIANGPDLLIADEPTSALDATIQREILDLLIQLRSDTNMALLVISHDPAVVRYVSERVVSITPIADSADSAITSGLYPSPQDPQTPMVTASHVGKRFGHTTAVDDVSFTIAKGTTFGLVGESGSGKSTLARAVLGLAPCDGTIVVDGVDVTNAKPKELRRLRRNMQFVAQNPYGSLDPRMTVRDIVAEPLVVHGIEDRGRVARLLEEVGLEVALHGVRPRQLSGGQRQRVAIARALVVEPTFVVLDEPVTSLDQPLRADILSLLRELRERHQLTYLLISHDFDSIRQLADHVAVMQAGQIVETGTVAAVLESPQHPYTQRLLTAQLPLV